MSFLSAAIGLGRKIASIHFHEVGTQKKSEKRRTEMKYPVCHKPPSSSFDIAVFSHQIDICF